jgi:hypothetical protein
MSLNYVELAYVDDNSDDDGLMIEAVRTSETSANFNETTEGCNLYPRLRENLNSHRSL